MMYQTKAASQSLTVIAQLVAIIVMAVKLLTGADIAADVAGLPETIAAAVDGVGVLVLLVVALYGRLRANKQITGLFKPKP